MYGNLPPSLLERVNEVNNEDQGETSNQNGGEV
jgi:hypothetical protein